MEFPLLDDSDQRDDPTEEEQHEEILSLFVRGSFVRLSA
jgi:hypothetical protein